MITNDEWEKWQQVLSIEAYGMHVRISLMACVMHMGEIGFEFWCDAGLFWNSMDWIVELGGIPYLAFVLWATVCGSHKWTL